MLKSEETDLGRMPRKALPARAAGILQSVTGRNIMVARREMKIFAGAGTGADALPARDGEVREAGAGKFMILRHEIKIFCP